MKKYILILSGITYLLLVGISSWAGAVSLTVALISVPVFLGLALMVWLTRPGVKSISHGPGN